MTDEPMPPAPPPASPQPPARTPTNYVHVVLTILTLLVLAAAVVTAYDAVMDVVRIWFEYQYVPIIRAILGIGVAISAVMVLRMLLRKGPAHAP